MRRLTKRNASFIISDYETRDPDHEVALGIRDDAGGRFGVGWLGLTGFGAPALECAVAFALAVRFTDGLFIKWR